MTESVTSFVVPEAMILCTDERLTRLLETELAYMGVASRSVSALPQALEGVSLLVADGDVFSPDDCRNYAAARGCLLLIFGREEISLPAEQGVFLRRPFALDRLEMAVRDLLPTVAVSLRPTIPVRPASASAPKSEPRPPLLTVQDGIVTVEGTRISMTPAEYAILERLYARRGEAVTRDELATLLGGGGNSVEVYVCKLRAKLEKPLGRRLILTVRGVGYRMEFET